MILNFKQILKYHLHFFFRKCILPFLVVVSVRAPNLARYCATGFCSSRTASMSAVKPSAVSSLRSNASGPSKNWTVSKLPAEAALCKQFWPRLSLCVFRSVTPENNHRMDTLPQTEASSAAVEPQASGWLHVAVPPVSSRNRTTSS